MRMLTLVEMIFTAWARKFLIFSFFARICNTFVTPDVL